jgi:hypothetical protein
MLGCFLSVNPVFLSMGGRGIRKGTHLLIGSRDFRIIGMGKIINTRFVAMFRIPIVRRWAEPWRH